MGRAEGGVCVRAWLLSERPALGYVNSIRAISSALRQVRPRVDRLAVVADLEVQHVAGGAAAAHLGDLFAGLHHLALVDQPDAVVAVGREPFVIVLDDHQFAVADQIGRASSRERVCRYVYILVVAVSLTKKPKPIYHKQLIPQ